jgi:hypothetical protein
MVVSIKLPLKTKPGIRLLKIAELLLNLHICQYHDSMQIFTFVNTPIAAERAEMEHAKQEAKERPPGQFLSLKQDKERRTFLFTGAYQKVELLAKDFYQANNIR